MKIEHTRVSQDGHARLASPQKTTYWSIEHEGKQYQLQQETNSAGRRLNFEYYVSQPRRCVSITPELTLVSASEVSFIDITLAVMLAKFIKEQDA